MNTPEIRFLYFLFSVILVIGISSCSEKMPELDRESKVKLALRAVGNDLLLSENDSTSLVMPIHKIDNNTYELTFEKPLAFDPGNLHASVATNFNKLGITSNYSVEVIQCNDEEIQYSFLMQENIDTSVVPCGGRVLPKKCYVVLLAFTSAAATTAETPWLFYSLVTLVVAFLLLVFYSKWHAFRSKRDTENVASIGIFRFYPDQNKLVKETEEISLSNKECELLAILSASPNQVVKREELTKRVWEDNGVIVGRSLDTYISKLRKKLQDDERIKITNVHGVGYKLELID